MGYVSASNTPTIVSPIPTTVPINFLILGGGGGVQTKSLAAGRALQTSVLGCVEDRHRVYRRAFDYAEFGGTRRDCPANALDRISDCSLRGLGGIKQHLSVVSGATLDGCLWFWFDPWLRFCQRAGRPWFAA